jgi:hypothetical protein
MPSISSCSFLLPFGFRQPHWALCANLNSIARPAFLEPGPLVRYVLIGGQELSYAKVKAIAFGNPAVLTLAEADAEPQRLSVLKKNHLDEQFVARRRVHDLPGTIAGMSVRLAKLSSDDATAKTFSIFSAASLTVCRSTSMRRPESRSASIAG